MKTTALIFVLALGLSAGMAAQAGAVQGQSKHQKKDLSPDEKATKSANWAEKELGLNAEQKQKWLEAEKEHQAGILPLKTKLQGSTTPDERRDLHRQLQSHHKTFETQVKTFLTADQDNAFDRKVAEKRQNRKEKRGKMN